MLPNLLGWASAALLALAASTAFYLGCAEQRLLSRPLSPSIATAAALIGVAGSALALTVVAGGLVSVFAALTLFMLCCTALPFVAGPRRIGARVDE
ncbi:MAG: hypothetical protein KIT37_08100 [Steroidobacteraceae bacterium]|nr:hypothetical protein [Steroidobacteraceae bacterium]